MKHLYLGLSFTFFFSSVMIVAANTAHFWWCVYGVKEKPEIPYCLHRRPFRMKAYFIYPFLLCDSSVKQTATKPQTQWKGMFGCEQQFLWGSIVCHPKKGYRGDYVRLSHIIRSAYAAGLNEDTTWLSLLSSVCEAKMHCKTNYTMVSIWLYETNPNTLML